MSDLWMQGLLDAEKVIKSHINGPASARENRETLLDGLKEAIVVYSDKHQEASESPYSKGYKDSIKHYAKNIHKETEGAKEVIKMVESL